MPVWDDYFLAWINKYYCGDYAGNEGTWNSCFYVERVVGSFVGVRACYYNGYC